MPTFKNFTAATGNGECMKFKPGLMPAVTRLLKAPKAGMSLTKGVTWAKNVQKDWNKNVAIYLTDKYSSYYIDYRKDFSTIQLGEFTDKITVTHVFPKPAMGNEVEETIKKAKKAWAAGNQTVAVYQSVASGQGKYILVYRLKEGLKELQSGYRKPMKERFDGANG